MLLPQLGERMGAVPASPIADGNQDILPAFHALDLAFQDSQFRRVDLIVGRVDRNQRRLDRLEVGRGIVIARSVKRIEHIVGIGLT